MSVIPENWTIEIQPFGSTCRLILADENGVNKGEMITRTNNLLGRNMNEAECKRALLTHAEIIYNG